MGNYGEVNAKNTVIIASIGTSNYEQAKTRFEDEKDGPLGNCCVKTHYSQIALAKLLGVRSIYLLATEEAQKMQEDNFHKESEKYGLEVIWHTVPPGSGAKEQWCIFMKLAEVAKPLAGSSVVFDITHGYRSIPMIFLLGATFLRTAFDMQVVGIYYTEFRKAKEGPHQSKIINLSDFLILQSWLEATRDFKRFGDAQEIGTLVRNIHNEFRRTTEHEPVRLGNIGDNLDDVSLAITFGRFMELRKQVRKLKEKTTGDNLKALHEELEQLGRSATPFPLLLPLILEPYYQMESDDQFQDGYRLVKWHVDHRNWTVAATLMRELMVNKVIVAVLNCNALNDRKIRARAEHMLNKIRNSRNPRLTQQVGATWSRITTYRNDLAHCGAKEERLRVTKLQTEGQELFTQFQAIMQWDDDRWREALKPVIGSISPSTPGEEGTLCKPRVLISAAGLSPGLLYTALLQVQPDYAIILASADTESKVAGSQARARYTGNLCILPMQNPFTGFDEAPELCKQLDKMLPADDQEAEVIVNLTGGTTAMQFVISRLGEFLESRGHEVQYVAMIDRRTPEEQRQDPYVKGEMIYCPTKI
ncbi:MAG: TM1812 family CRISPR-associated protein [Limnochordia bacterium]